MAKCLLHLFKANQAACELHEQARRASALGDFSKARMLYYRAHQFLKLVTDVCTSGHLLRVVIELKLNWALTSGVCVVFEEYRTGDGYFAPFGQEVNDFITLFLNDMPEPSPFDPITGTIIQVPDKQKHLRPDGVRVRQRRE